MNLATTASMDSHSSPRPPLLALRTGRKRGWLAVMLGVASFGLSGASSQAALALTISHKLSHLSGTDTLGLNNATVTFNATFANGVVYTNVFGAPGAAATTHSVTISGATNAASNGTFSDPNGFLYVAYAGFEGLFTDEPVDFYFYRTPTLASGLSFKYGLSLSAPPIAPGFGDFVNATDFASTARPSPSFSSLEAVINDTAAPTATYGISGTFTSSYVGSSNPIPEPGSLLLLGATSLLLVRTRRRQSLN